MKNLRRMLTLVLLFVSTTCLFVACDSELFLDPESPEGKLATFRKYFEVKVVDAERVGDNLMVELEITNKTTTSSSLNIWRAEVVDNKGGKDYDPDIRFGESEYQDYDVTSNVRGGATVKTTIKIKKFGFDTDNKKSVSLMLSMRANDMEMSDQVDYLVTDKLTWKDNRVTADGVQTCDRNLVFDVLSCQRQENGDCLVKYTVQNLTSRTINYEVWPRSCFDNVGNEYSVGEFGDLSYAFGDEDLDPILSWWSLGDFRSQLRPGATLESRILVKHFSPSAKTLNIYMGCKDYSNTYFFDDDYTRFLDIPVK